MTDFSKLEGHGEASKAVLAHLSPRAKRLAELERWVKGTQYTGRPHFFSEEAPLSERAPCIIYPIVRAAIDSFVDLVLGEGRFPTAKIGNTDEDSPWDDEDALEDDDRELGDRFVLECIKQSRFERVARECLAAGMGCGSAALVLGARNGKLIADTVKARWCEPELDVDGNVERLEIKYPYLEQYQEGRSLTWKVRARMYRRVIDDERDTTYKPAEIAADEAAPVKWVADPERTHEHGLGFCPVVWYPFMRGCSVEGVYDGHAIHENLLDEVEALDFSLSQRHRAALYAGDPQWTEIGVEPGSNPSSAAVRKGHPASPKGGEHPDDATCVYQAGPSKVRKGRKKSPGDVWQYEAPDVQVKLHTLPGEALKAIDDHCNDLRGKLAEALSVVFLDLDTVRFVTSVSGKALEALRSRQIDRCDQIRDDVEDGLIIPSATMLLRIAYVLGKAGKLQVPGLKQVIPIFGRWDDDKGDGDAVAAA